MTGLFTTVVEMSVKAAAVILVVLVLRVCLAKAPKKYSYALWAAAAFRLLCPVSVSSVFSLFNFSVVQVKEQTVIKTSGNAAAQAVPAAPAGTIAVTNQYTPAVTEPTAAAVNWDEVLSVVWILGAVIVLTVLCVQLLRLRHRTRFAVRVEGNVWECDDIPGPFVFGLLRPRVYLPVRLEGERREHVLAHERYHIRRRDNWVKALCQVILAIHWFNPFVWLMMWALDRDMELSCDEGALKQLGQDSRESYGRTLLSLAVSRREFAPVLAFGAPAVKRRIINVLRYHKAAKITVVLAVLVLLAAGLTCCTDANTRSYSTETYARALDDARTEYVGDNSAVVTLIQTITEETQCQLRTVELHTGEEPYGLTLKLDVPESTPQETYQKEMLRIGTLLLALVDNLSWCEVGAVRPYDPDIYLENLYCYSVSMAEEWLDISDLKILADTPEGIVELLERVEQADTGTVCDAAFDARWDSTAWTYYPEGQPNGLLSLVVYSNQYVDDSYPEHQHSFVYYADLARSEDMIYGTWTESDGIITCTSHDGQVMMMFTRQTDGTLVFSEGNSYNAGIEDGTSFVSVGSAQIVESRFVYDGAGEMELLLLADGAFRLNWIVDDNTAYSYIGEWSLRDIELAIQFYASAGTMYFACTSGNELRFLKEKDDLTGFEVYDSLEDGACFLLDDSWKADGSVQVGIAVIDTQVEYYQLETEMQSSDLFLPTLRIYSDGTYVFNYSMLSSRYYAGTWTEENGLLTLVDNGGTQRFTFRRVDGSTLQFSEEGSYGYDQYPQFEVVFGDGDLFRKSSGSETFSWPELVLVSNGARYEIQGLDAAYIEACPSGSSVGDIYFADPVFLGDYFKDRNIEGHACWVDESHTSIQVGFTQSAGGADGTLTGPCLNFRLDLVTGALSHVTYEPYEGQKVTLPESEMQRMGYMLASLLGMVEQTVGG